MIRKIIIILFSTLVLAWTFFYSGVELIDQVCCFCLTIIFSLILLSNKFNSHRIGAVSVILGTIIFLMLSAEFSKIKLNSPAPVVITLNGKWIRNDNIRLYFTTKLDDRFLYKNSIKKKIKGKKEEQIVRFQLDADNVAKLNLEVSNNKHQKTININSITISYKNKDLVLDGNNIDDYFMSNNLLIRQKANSYVIIPSENKERASLVSSQLTNELLMEFMKANYPGLPFPFSLSLILSILIIVMLLSRVHIPVFQFHKLIVVTFCILLIFPSVSIFLPVFQLEVDEKREKAGIPDFDINDLGSFIEGFTNYINDNFGLRNQLIQFGSQFKLYFFNSSIAPNKAVIGKDNWLFFTDMKENAIQYFEQNNLYTHDELDNILGVLLKRRDYLASKEISYHKIYWPNKNTIYGEKLPDRMKKIKRDTISRAEQVISFVNGQPNNFKILDVKPLLLNKKDQHQLYYKIDTHWNMWGAYYSFNYLLNAIKKDYPDLKILQESEYDVVISNDLKGDLMSLTGLPKTPSYTEDAPIFKSKFKRVFKNEFIPNLDVTHVVIDNNSAANDLKLLVFGDSYCNLLKGFIGDHFTSALVVDGNYDPGLIEQFEPDIVIEAFVERQLLSKGNRPLQ